MGCKTVVIVVKVEDLIPAIGITIRCENHNNPDLDKSEPSKKNLTQSRRDAKNTQRESM